jgi:multiple sugar transport system substrate-binding protein
VNIDVTRRRALGIAGMLAGAGGLAACGSSSGGSSSGGSKKLTYWASNQAPTTELDKKILTPVLAQFTKQTGISVDITVIPWSDLYTKILTATTSGNGPDILNIGNTWSAALQATGAFVPFDTGTLAKIGGKQKFFSTSYATSGAVGKTPTSVPLYGLAYGLFYNKALFSAAGITAPPTTWTEFLTVAKKLTNPAKSVYGFGIEGASVSENAHWAFILGRQQGGELFTDGKPTFASAAQVRGVKQYLDYMSVDKVVSPNNAEYDLDPELLGDFAKNKVAMVCLQAGAAATLKSLGMSESLYGVAPIPLPDPMPTGGAPVESHAAGINLSVFTNTGNEDNALKMVKFMTETSTQTTLNAAFGSLPVVNAAYSDKTFQTPFYQTFKTVLADHSEPMPLISAEGQMETLVGTALKGLWAKAATGPVSEAQILSALTQANQQMAAAS